MDKIVIVDYGMGNLFSIQHALKFVGADVSVSSDRTAIVNADRLILPGVGAFEHAMLELQNLNLIDAINAFVQSGRPVLGICLGMQLLFTESNEFGRHKGLNLISGKVVRFKEQTSGQPYKIPQMGWNKILAPLQEGRPSDPETRWRSTLLDGIPAESFLYFVHSYICAPDEPGSILAETVYGQDRFCSVTNRENVWGCQFHPEKSGETGLRIYRNFINTV